MSCRGVRGGRALMSPSSPSSLHGPGHGTSLRMETHNRLPRRPPRPCQPPQMESPGAEMAMLRVGHPHTGAGGRTASSQAQPHVGCRAARAVGTRGGLSSLWSLKGSAFCMTVNEEITYSPV